MSRKKVTTESLPAVASWYCDDCDEHFEEGDMAVIVTLMAQRNIVLLKLHKACARDIGSDLVAEIARI